VLGNGYAGRGANQRGGGGDVERAQAVAAGADHIENFAAVPPGGIKRRGNGLVAQRPGERGDFVRGLAF